jgi:GNAT superfamily N-acetyltransferase
MNISITPITFDDLPGLLLLFNELVPNSSSISHIQSNFEKISTNECYFLLGAKVDNQLCGTLMGVLCHDLIGECRPFLVIENVIVTKNFRKRGVGKALMNRIEEIARQHNCYYSILISGENRTDAHAFYDSLGYGDTKVKGFKKFL